MFVNNDEMERRGGLYVSMNGAHSDLSIVVVVTLLGKSALFRVMFFARDFSSEEMSVVTKYAGMSKSFVRKMNVSSVEQIWRGLKLKGMKTNEWHVWCV